MKILILLTLLLPCIAGAKIYKSVDAEGNTVYADIPDVKDAKELDLPELNVINAQKIKAKLPDKVRTKKDGRHYKSIKITSPENDVAFRHNAGEITINVELEPALMVSQGDQLTIEMDGNIVNNSNNSAVILKNVDRGTHSITARVTNANDPTIAKATSITFHLIRFSISN